MTANISMEEDGEDLVIRIQRYKTVDYGLSASGKTITVASTKGNQQYGDSGVYIGLNAYKYPPRK